jgi:hypothetical protein
MGLDLRVYENKNAKSFGMCSYSGVQAFRKYLTERALVSGWDLTQNETQYLQRWILNGEIDYDSIEDKPQLKNKYLKGLYYFVNHSDCIGQHSPGRCKLILDAIKNMILDQQGADYWALQLEELPMALQCAIDNNKPLLYC